jgi:hypothetical protein
MYCNFVAIDGVIKKQKNTQQDATLKGCYTHFDMLLPASIESKNKIKLL